eukprot:COSAG02_NODE_2050_length_10003_cov_585.950525_6_plen_771_part_00
MRAGSASGRLGGAAPKPETMPAPSETTLEMQNPLDYNADEDAHAAHAADEEEGAGVVVANQSTAHRAACANMLMRERTLTEQAELYMVAHMAGNVDEVCKKLDSDGSGYLGREEICRVLGEFRQLCGAENNINDSMVETIFKEIAAKVKTWDSFYPDQVSLTEFRTWYGDSSHRIRDQVTEKFYEVTAHTGSMFAKQQVMTLFENEFGRTPDAAELDEVWMEMLEMSKDRDMQIISLDEFLNWYHNSEFMTLWVDLKELEDVEGRQQLGCTRLSTVEKLSLGKTVGMGLLDNWSDAAVMVSFFLSGDKGWFWTGVCIQATSGAIAGILLAYGMSQLTEGRNNVSTVKHLPKTVPLGVIGLAPVVAATYEFFHTLQERLTLGGPQTICPENNAAGDEVTLRILRPPGLKGQWVTTVIPEGVGPMQFFRLRAFKNVDAPRLQVITPTPSSNMDRNQDQEQQHEEEHEHKEQPEQEQQRDLKVEQERDLKVEQGQDQPHLEEEGLTLSVFMKMFAFQELILEALPQSCLQTYVGVAYGEFNYSSPDFSWLLVVSVGTAFIFAGMNIWGVETLGRADDLPPSMLRAFTAYGAVTILGRASQVGSMVFGNALLLCAYKAWAIPSIAVTVILLGLLALSHHDHGQGQVAHGLLLNVFQFMFTCGIAAVFFSDMPHSDNNYADRGQSDGSSTASQNYNCRERRSGITSYFATMGCTAVFMTLSFLLDPKFGYGKTDETRAQLNEQIAKEKLGASEDDSVETASGTVEDLLAVVDMAM